MFIGREKEIADLNRRYNSTKFELAAVYGRRRVGKTTLLGEFSKNKNCIFFTSEEASAKQNLEGLSADIYTFAGMPNGGCFADFEQAFETVFNLSEDRRILFIIDEYPYLAASDKSIASILQKLIDRHKEKSKLFLVLCGSSMSFMEEQLMDYKSPLYGRRTCQYKILPFDYIDSRKFVRRFSKEDAAIAYALSGGVPLYLSMFDDELSIRENIINNFLTPSSYLYEEAPNLIKQECRDASSYNSVVTAMAAGLTRVSEISDRTGISQVLVLDYLKKLISLGIVKKEKPYGTGGSKKTLYSISDTMFRFWYRFVPKCASMIGQGMQDVAYEYIKPLLSDFMGTVFEDVCKQYLWRIAAEQSCPVRFSEMGRWWGTDPTSKSSVEIDIMADDGNGTALFAECKWKNAITDTSVCKLLKKRGSRFGYAREYYYVFSKSGFTEGSKQYAKESGNFNLISFDDM